MVCSGGDVWRSRGVVVGGGGSGQKSSSRLDPSTSHDKHCFTKGCH